MSHQLTKEIPQSRVNITLDLETNGASIKQELPLRILVLNNFCSQQQQVGLGQRNPMKVSNDNLNAVMKKIKPYCSMQVPNLLLHRQKYAISKDKPASTNNATTNNATTNNATTHIETLSIHLRPRSMQDLKPEAIAHQVPELKTLLGIRQLLLHLNAKSTNDPKLGSIIQSYINTTKKRFANNSANNRTIQQASE